MKDDSQATIVCPACSSAKTISVEEFRHRQHVLKVKCKCGNSFSLQLEFRQFFRKDTELQGVYDIKPPARGGGIANIVNLSLVGACFEVRGVHDLKIGHKGSLVFTLDNRKETVLYRQVIIRSVDGNRIGVEFVAERAFEKELGFYLLP
ncbi:PilZ domain-containing protein [Desulforhopalus sp. 52FAK]